LKLGFSRDEFHATFADMATVVTNVAFLEGKKKWSTWKLDFDS